MEQENNANCGNCTLPCWKFIIASSVSTVTTITGIVILFVNPSVVLLPISTSMLGANISFWLTPPSIWKE